MNDSAIEKAAGIRGVRAVAMVKAPGEVTKATVESDELKKFFAMLFRGADDLGKATGLGRVSAVFLRSEKQEHLSLFVENDGALAIVSDRSRPLGELGTEVKEMLGRG